MKLPRFLHQSYARLFGEWKECSMCHWNFGTHEEYGVHYLGNNKSAQVCRFCKAEAERQSKVTMNREKVQVEEEKSRYNREMVKAASESMHARVHVPSDAEISLARFEALEQRVTALERRSFGSGTLIGPGRHEFPTPPHNYNISC